jgi:hypothetical protein
LENIPKDCHAWDVSVRRAGVLAETLFNAWDEALLFRTLATLRLDVPVFESIDELRWKSPRPEFEQLCQRIKMPDLLRRVEKMITQRARG